MTSMTRPAPPPPVLLLVLRAVATVVAVLLFCAGWTVGKLIQAGSWTAAAVRLGFDDARRPGER